MNKVETEKLTIYEVESFHKKLIEWCEKSNEAVLIDCSDLKIIDLPALQLLLSAQKSCEGKGIRFELANVSPEVCKTIQNAGCAPLLKGCV